MTTEMPHDHSPENSIVLRRSDILNPDAFEKLRAMTSEQREELMRSILDGFEQDDERVAELLQAFQQIMNDEDGFEIQSPDKHTVLLSFAPVMNVVNDLRNLGQDVADLLNQAVTKFVFLARNHIMKGSLITIHKNGDTINAFIVNTPVIQNNGVLVCQLTEATFNDSGEPRANVKEDGKQCYSINLVDFPVSVKKSFHFE